MNQYYWYSLGTQQRQYDINFDLQIRAKVLLWEEYSLKELTVILDGVYIRIMDKFMSSNTAHTQSLLVDFMAIYQLVHNVDPGGNPLIIQRLESCLHST